MHLKRLVLFVLCVSMLGGVALADDKDDVLTLIDEYCRLEGTGDLAEQAAKIISPDRVFISFGRRLTDQAANTRSQQAIQDRDKKMDTETQVIVMPVDIIVRFHGDAAVASFYRHWHYIYSPARIREQGSDLPSSWYSDIVTLVLAKEGANWKIVHFHHSPYHP